MILAKDLLNSWLLCWVKSHKQTEGVLAIGAKAFKFKLQPVLEMRQRHLEQIQNYFAQQLAKIEQTKTILLSIQEEIELILNPDPLECSDGVLSNQRFQYIQLLKSQADHVVKVLTQQEKDLEQIREALKHAHIQKKSLEMLKEKQEKQYIHHIEEQESKTLEDIVLARMHYQKK